jgi:hypothetical protein
LPKANWALIPGPAAEHDQHDRPICGETAQLDVLIALERLKFNVGGCIADLEKVEHFFVLSLRRLKRDQKQNKRQH